jgi:hypothetical protein
VTQVCLDVGFRGIYPKIALYVCLLDPLDWNTHVSGEQAVGAHPEGLDLAGAVNLDPIDWTEIAIDAQNAAARCDVLLVGGPGVCAPKPRARQVR